MLELDGSAGGGQLLRTALALSAVTGTPFEMSGVRGDRDEPGLRPQHLTALETVAAVTDAAVEGAETGATRVRFEPGAVEPGRYEAAVGTAGSLTLLFDAVLPLAAGLEGPLALAATGGTDVAWSPTAAHYRRVKLPLLRALGLPVAVELDRPGFYPAGGGAATLRLWPASPGEVTLVDRGSFEGARVYSTAATALADADVAARQADAAAEVLARAGLAPVERVVRTADADCPGSAVCVRLDYGDGVAGFDDRGEPGRPAEEVGTAAADAAVGFDGAAGAVDRHLGDQLVVVLALAGGRVRLPAVTDHVRAGVDLLGSFGVDAELRGRGEGALLVVPSAAI